MTDTADTPVRIEHLPPGDLDVAADTVRTTMDGLDRLTESVRRLGVLQPLVIRYVDGRPTVVMGQRRRAAAMDAGLATVPCLVADPGLSDDDARRLLAMLGENAARADLTVAEHVAAVQRALDLGITADDLAAATGRPADDVARAAAVAAAPIARKLTERHPQLTLDQAAALAEFADDRDAVKTLAVAATKTPDSFPHVLARARRDRKEAAAIAAEVAKLEAAGVEVLESGHVDGTARRLTALGIRPAQHRKCAGAAAVVVWNHMQDKPEVIHYCTKAAEHPAAKTPPPAGRPAAQEPTPEEAEAQRNERRQVRENNAAWRAATDVRLAHLVDVLARPDAPAAALAYLADTLADNPHLLAAGTRSDVAAKLDVPAKRPPAIRLLAMLAIGHEATMDVATWRQPSRRVAAWLDFLRSATGYTLSDVEKTVVAEGKKARW